MTRQATLAATGGVVVERFRIGDLSTLWHAGAHLMAFVTSHLVVLRMAEANAKCLRELRRARIATQLMTGAA